MTDNGGSDHIGDKLVFLPIPSKKNRARTPSAIELFQHKGLARRNIDLVLRDACRP